MTHAQPAAETNAAKTGQTLAEWLAEAPFGLTLSSGFFGFFAHCGMLSALETAGVVPSRITGSSAGALVGGTWASGVDASDLRDVLFALRRPDFWDPAPGLGLLRGQLFQTKLRQVLGAETFASCRVPLAISLYDVKARRTVVANAGNLATAIAGSCAFPGLFQPVKWEGRWVLDGGIADRPGLAAVASGERTLFHHLSSRSPWRRRHSPALKPPTMANLTSLIIEGLPRLNPFQLERGPNAYQMAYDATSRALSRPVDDRIVARPA